jgi:hypothetical protein
MLRKLSSPSKEDEMKKSHDKLLRELIADPESEYRDSNSFVISVINGLHFTMEELKVFKALVLSLNKLMCYIFNINPYLTFLIKHRL